MDELKNYIENNRQDFENESVPDNHKERFIAKLQKNRRVEARTFLNKRFSFYFAAASVALLLILTPMMYLNKLYNNRALDVSDYIGILEDRSVIITQMADKLNTKDRDMVLSTLDQITFEAIPFNSQLSNDVRNGERSELIKRYYAPKIEGVDKLEKYVALLNKEN